MTSRRRITFCLLFILALNAALWAGSRKMYAGWAGVPPAPSRESATALTLGDTEMSFRTGALMLQNIGDGGGRITPLKDYDYGRVGAWLRLLHGLNPASEHLPMVAAYYYGADRTPAHVAVIVDYLAMAGQNPAGEKFRWLADAAFLARHRMNNLPLALDIATTLSRMEPLDRPLPPWARQLPAFILKEQGEKEAARKIMEDILKTQGNLPPQEKRFMQDYLVNQLGADAAEVEVLLEGRK